MLSAGLQWCGKIKDVCFSCSFVEVHHHCRIFSIYAIGLNSFMKINLALSWKQNVSHRVSDGRPQLEMLCSHNWHCFLGYYTCEKSLGLVMLLQEPQNLSAWEWKAAFSDVLRHPSPEADSGSAAGLCWNPWAEHMAAPRAVRNSWKSWWDHQCCWDFFQSPILLKKSLSYFQMSFVWGVLEKDTGNFPRSSETFSSSSRVSLAHLPL